MDDATLALISRANLAQRGKTSPVHVDLAPDPFGEMANKSPLGALASGVFGRFLTRKQRRGSNEWILTCFMMFYDYCYYILLWFTYSNLFNMFKHGDFPQLCQPCYSNLPEGNESRIPQWSKYAVVDPCRSFAVWKFGSVAASVSQVGLLGTLLFWGLFAIYICIFPIPVNIKQSQNGSSRVLPSFHG